MTGRGSRLHKSTKLCSYATTFKSEISDDMSEDDSSEGAVASLYMISCSSA
jgi:hypothetical protein